MFIFFFNKTHKSSWQRLKTSGKSKHFSHTWYLCAHLWYQLFNVISMILHMISLQLSIWLTMISVHHFHIISDLHTENFKQIMDMLRFFFLQVMKIFKITQNIGNIRWHMQPSIYPNKEFQQMWHPMKSSLNEQLSFKN